MISSLALAACQTIPNVKFYREIPFQDCPEAVYVESVTRKTGLVSCEDYKKLRPFMLMIDPDGVRDIKLDWKKNCRVSGDSCNVPLESVDGALDALDGLAGSIIKP